MKKPTCVTCDYAEKFMERKYCVCWAHPHDREDRAFNRAFTDFCGEHPHFKLWQATLDMERNLSIWTETNMEESVIRNTTTHGFYVGTEVEDGIERPLFSEDVKEAFVFEGVHAASKVTEEWPAWIPLSIDLKKES